MMKSLSPDTFILGHSKKRLPRHRESLDPGQVDRVSDLGRHQQVWIIYRTRDVPAESMFNIPSESTFHAANGQAADKVALYE
jgi:hypothetical protein